MGSAVVGMLDGITVGDREGRLVGFIEGIREGTTEGS